MVGEPIVTVVGGITADPELRYTQNGLPMVSFTIAQTPRTFDRSKNEYVDGEPLFLRCTVWRDYAEHVAASLLKGMQVIAQGRLVSNTYTTKDGDKRTSMELQVDDIGPTLRFATAQVLRTGSRTQANNQAQQRAQDQGQQWQQPVTTAPQNAGAWQQPPAQVGNTPVAYQQPVPPQPVQQELWNGAPQAQNVDPNAPF